MDYQKQGKDFLSKHGVKMLTKFIKNDVYFSDDKEPRDIFRITFTRCLPIKIDCKLAKNNSGKIIINEDRRFSIKFGQSINDSTGSGSHHPTPYDVLACLTKYEPGTFENFCGDFGYDTDSRQAEKIYKAICKEWENVYRFFTFAEIVELQEIQ